MSTYPTDPAYSYPLTARLEYETRIVTGKNGAEQRWQINPGRASWDLNYPHLTLTQRDVLITFFEARKGSKDLFDFAFAGTTYTNCYFDSDKLSAVESSPKSYAVSLKICKVSRTPDTGTLGSDFPVLANSAKMQLPYTHERTFDTVAVVTDTGRSAFSKRSSSLRKWSAGGTVLTVAEAQAIWDYFSKAQGRYKTFGFTDPDSAAHVTSCRFGEDTAEWKFISPSQNSLTVNIQEFV